MLASCSISGASGELRDANKHKDLDGMRSGVRVEVPACSLRKTYELLSRYLRAGCSNELAEACVCNVCGGKFMNVLFLLICSVSVVFFAVFLFGCSRPLRKSKKGAVLRRLTEDAVIDSATGRRFFAHIEQQMAEFLAHHGRTTAM